MSDFASALERARRAFATVAEFEAAAIQAPYDRAIQVNLATSRRLAERLQAYLFEAAEESQVDICRYRLVPSSRGNYYLSSVSQSLDKFQHLFSMIYDAVTNGPKKRASLRPELVQETSFNFGYSFAGSLGIVLTIEGQRQLFGDKFDYSVDTFHKIFSTTRSDEFRALARQLGDAVVTSAYSWSLENAIDEFSVDIQWKMSNGLYKGEMIDQQRLERVVGIIEQVADEKAETRDIYGKLVGIDLSTKKFHLKVGQRTSIQGRLADEFPIYDTIEVGKHYRARIKTVTKIIYATGSEEVDHRLLLLMDPP